MIPGVRKVGIEKGGEKMDANLTYNECELVYLQNEWLDPSWAAEICARTGEHGAYDGTENSIEEETWNIFTGS
jgi:hypothetical protein